MSRVSTFVAVGVIIILTIYMQQAAQQLIGPGTPLWNLIADITWPVDGDVWAEEMYVAISVWFMWIIRVAAIVGGIYREFVKQNVTAQAARRPR
jgi:hypothetical protein